MNKTHAQRIQEADKFVADKAAVMNRRFYPLFHLSAPSGWINDPNGFCHALGQYHMFYQHYPYDSKWGPMHWGHAVSDDLVTWHNVGIALAPGEEYDRDGCFSGSAIEHEGKLYLLYTGHVFLEKFGDDTSIREVQCLAVSEDGLHFEKLGPVIEPPADFMHFRDPKVFKGEDGRFYCVVGGRTVSYDEGHILLFASSDLKHWERLEDVLTCRDNDPHTFMYECPDLFPVPGKDGCYAVATSPMGLSACGTELNNPSITQWQTGTFVQHQFRADSAFAEIDRGFDFYASQTCEAPDGRRILTAWQSMWKMPFPEAEDGWCASLIVPREVTCVGGKLIQQPVREFASLRQNACTLPSQQLENCSKVIKAGSSACEVLLQVQRGSAESCGVSIGNSLTLFLDRQHGELTLLRKDQVNFGQRCLKIDVNAPLKLRLLIDVNSVEAFINDGSEVMTACFYPHSGERDVQIFAMNGTASFSDITMYDIRPCIDR